MTDFYLILGSKNICLRNPKPEQIDIPAVKERLYHIHRFSNDPKALSVAHHETFVALLCEHDPLHVVPSGLQEACITWAEVHDHPEAITGDIPGPLKKYLVMNGCFELHDLEGALERVILQALELRPSVDAEVRRAVGAYDQVARALEWFYHMGRDWDEWCHPRARRIKEPLVRQLLASATTKEPS